MASQSVLETNSSSSTTNSTSSTSSDAILQAGDFANDSCPDQSNYDVSTAAHLLVSLDTSSIHSPPDITLLTQFGDDDDDSYSSSVSSPDDQQMLSINNSRNSQSFPSANRSHLTQVVEEDVTATGSFHSNYSKKERCEVMSPKTVDNINVGNLQVSRYDAWKPIPVSDDQEFPNNFSGPFSTYNNSPSQTNASNSNQSILTNCHFAPPEDLTRSDNSHLISALNSIDNVHQQSNNPLSWMSNSTALLPFDVTHSNASAYNTNHNCSSHAIQLPSSSRINKPYLPDTNVRSNNFQSVNQMEESQYDGRQTENSRGCYTKLSSNVQNYSQTDNLLTCCDNSSYHSGNTTGTTNNTNQSTRSTTVAGGHFNFVFPLNNSWNHTGFNNNFSPIINEPEMYSPSTNSAVSNYGRLTMAPMTMHSVRPSSSIYHAPLPMAKPTVNYNLPFAGDMQSVSQVPFYYQMPCSYALPLHNFPNFNSSTPQPQVFSNNKFFKPKYNCEYLELGNNCEIGNNRVIDMSTKQPRPRTNYNSENQQLQTPVSSAPTFEIDSAVVSNNRYMSAPTCLACSSSTTKTPQMIVHKSIKETLQHSVNSTINSEKDCLICMSTPVQQAKSQSISSSRQISGENPNLLPSFRDTFGSQSMDVMAKRLNKPKNAYVTVRQLLLSRRNDEIAQMNGDRFKETTTSLQDQDEIYLQGFPISNSDLLGEMKEQSSHQISQEREPTTTNNSSSTVVSSSISLPISSVILSSAISSSCTVNDSSNCKLSRKRKSYRKSSSPNGQVIHLSSNENDGKSTLLPAESLDAPATKATSILHSRLMGIPVEELNSAGKVQENDPNQEKLGASVQNTSTSTTVAVTDPIEETLHTFDKSGNAKARRSTVLFCRPCESKTDYKPPRHYDLLCLKIGTFRVVQPVSTPTTNRLKVYFIKKSFVYEFDITNLQRTETIAAIEIPFSSIAAIHCEESEVLISVRSVPKLFLGIKQKRSGAVKSVAQFDRDHPTDITDGQLFNHRIHKLYLKHRQGDNLRSYLLMFEDAFRGLLDTPVYLGSSNENQQVALPETNINHGNSGINFLARYCKRQCVEIVGSSGTTRRSTVNSVVYVACHCQVTCSSNRCSCMKSKSKCGLSGSGCMCRDCDNPLNILESEGINIHEAVIDTCLSQKIINFKGDLRQFLETEISIDCCGSKTKVKCCIPGRVRCTNANCERKPSFKYSWCIQQLFYEDLAPRNHCSACKMCKDPIDLHCQVCRKCNPIGGNGAKCTFCGNLRDTEFTENDVAAALLRYRNGPTSQKVYQAVQGTNKGTVCRLETASASVMSTSEKSTNEEASLEPEVVNYDEIEVIIEKMDSFDSDKSYSIE